jgi:hypothetical protein
MPDATLLFKSAVERLLAAGPLDWSEAIDLVSEIAHDSAEVTLRQAASQALPILRAAAGFGADHTTHEAARRRLFVVLDVLIELTTPRFGRRGAAPKPLSADQRARRLLGLPIDGPLSGPEIHGAFRRAAKIMHPDAGGSEDAFRELAAAQDVLMNRPC